MVSINLDVASFIYFNSSHIELIDGFCKLNKMHFRIHFAFFSNTVFSDGIKYGNCCEQFVYVGAAPLLLHTDNNEIIIFINLLME